MYLWRRLGIIPENLASALALHKLSNLLCFALRFFVVFIENIRSPIVARNGGFAPFVSPQETDIWLQRYLFSCKIHLIVQYESNCSAAALSDGME